MDNEYDKDLEKAVTEFQKQNGIVDDGVFGHQSILKLDEVLRKRDK